MASILWLTPDKPDNISIGRKRIANHIRDRGHFVELRGVSGKNLLVSLVDIHSFDIVVGTTHSGAIIGAFLAYISDLPFIVDHIDPIAQLYGTASSPVVAIVNKLELHAFQRAEKVFFVYEEERTRVASSTDSWEKVELGADIDKFENPSVASIDAAKGLLANFDTNENIVVYVGGLEQIYNIHSMVEAMENLDCWSLVIAGVGSEEKYIETKDESDGIVYLGSIPHDIIPGLFKISDVGISLVDDPYTLKVLEYGAAGLPVVQLKGRAENRFGDLVEYTSNNPQAIAEAIESAADRDPEPFQRFVSNFDWEIIGDKYMNTIEHELHQSS